MSPAIDPRFRPLSEAPVVVAPQEQPLFRTDGVTPLARPLTAPELAGYLAAAEYCLAPATDDVCRQAPGTAWICWWRIASGVPLYGGLVRATSLGHMEAHWREAFALRLFIDDVRREVRRALNAGPVDMLDATRAWLQGQPSDTRHVPGVLLHYPRASLAAPRSNPPEAYRRLSPAQWRRGAVLHRRYLRQWRRGEDLLWQARGLVDAEERRRIGSVASATDARVKRRL